MAQREGTVFFRKTSQLMLSTEIMAVCCGSHTQYVNVWFGNLGVLKGRSKRFGYLEVDFKGAGNT